MLAEILLLLLLGFIVALSGVLLFVTAVFTYLAISLLMSEEETTDEM